MLFKTELSNFWNVDKKYKNNDSSKKVPKANDQKENENEESDREINFLHFEEEVNEPLLYTIHFQNFILKHIT